jgi:nucleoside-diphosphate-sugar epimerase
VRLLVFGLGYVGQAVAVRAVARGWTVSATSRQVSSPPSGVDMLSPAQAFEAALAADAVLITTPPGERGCPAAPLLMEPLSRGAPRWIGYLSSTGVYGDLAGRWVFEDSPLRARSLEGARRVAAEHDWLQFGRITGRTVTVFRLPGIYGPGRSPFDRLRSGRARSVVRPGQVFSRIHLDDLAAGLEASMARPRAGGVYNLCDDEPAPAPVVTAYAATLLGLPPPAPEPYDEAAAAPQARRFYAESKRVSNALAKAELGWRPAYPTYREGLAAILAAEAG